MEVAQAEVRSRGRAMAVEETVENSGSAKRMKVGNGELRLSSSKSERITDNDVGDVIATLKNCADSVEDDLRELSGDATSLITSGDVQASCCSSNGSIMEKLKSADLEEIRTEVETTINCKFDGRESTQTSEFKEESGELESSTTSKPSVLIIDSRRTIPTAKSPPAAELEEFFATAEENLHKSFEDNTHVLGTSLHGGWMRADVCSFVRGAISVKLSPLEPKMRKEEGKKIVIWCGVLRPSFPPIHLVSVHLCNSFRS